MLRVLVLALWVGLLVLAASCASIWKATCVPNLDASNNSESMDESNRFTLD